MKRLMTLLLITVIAITTFVPVVDAAFTPVNRAEYLRLVLPDAGYTIWSGGSTSCVFTDMTGSEWYYPYFITACEGGIISDGIASASLVLNRAEAVKIAYDVYSVPYSVPFTPTYFDVQPSAWYYEEVESLHAYGVFGSIGISLFHPEALLTRRDALRWMSVL